MGSPEAELSVLITSDAEMLELNSHYRGKHAPTDVLSFSLREGEGADLAGELLGDVVISVDTATRQAAEQGVSLQEELLRLLIHGILHLFGYDHENVPDEEADRMRAKERELYMLLVPA